MKVFKQLRPIRSVSPTFAFQKKLNKKSLLAPIFLTVLIDMLGVGIIIPVLPALFVAEDTSFLPKETTDVQRALLYGYLTALYPIMQFFGAPILGTLSDRYGRKPLLLVSLIGTAIGYLLFGFAILMKNLPLLFVSRALPGFTGGNISIVYSAISDITKGEPQNRPKYFGLVGMAFGLGFILGPALGGILSDRSVFYLFDHSTPFWFSFLLILLNIVLLQRYFPETLLKKSTRPISFLTGVKNIRKAFGSPNLKGIFSVSLLYSLGFSFFTQFFAYYMMKQFPEQIKEKEIGLIFAWVGIWLVFTQGVTVRQVSKRFSSEQVLLVSILCLGVAIPCNLIPQVNPWLVLIVSPFVATCHGLTSPNLTTVVSKQADEDEQGEILGINQSMMSVGQAVPPLAAAYLTGINPASPIIIAGGVVFLSWLVYLRLKNRGFGD